MTTLLREECIEYSMLQALKEGLPSYGFVLNGEPNPTVNLREAFPTPDERAQELAITTVAFGFNIDDGGKLVELGSDLTAYKHTLMVWTFATEPRFGRRLAHSIKHIVRRAEELPLLDYNQEGNPQIDTLRVEKAQVRHEINQSPRPWDQFVWTTGVVVLDISTP